MTAQRELELSKELQDLRSKFSILDKSDENRLRGERISEIRNELGLVCKPKATRRKARVVNR